MAMRAKLAPFLAPVAAVAVLLGAAACTTPQEPVPRPISNTPEPSSREVDITIASYNAADQLIENSAAALSPAKPILITTMVDSGDLTRTTALGRLISEQMASRLANAGYTVHELKLGPALRIREGTGELILTRDVRELSRVAGAQAIIAGTYTVANSRVFVNAKLVQAVDGRMLSAADFEMPKSRDVHSLLMTDATARRGPPQIDSSMQTYTLPSPADR